MEIPLRNKHKEVIAHALCSPEDYDELMKYKWHKAVRGGYPQACINGSCLTMHLFLMRRLHNIQPGGKVDHIDNNVLNNQRPNLRLVTVSQNNANRKKSDSAACASQGVYTTPNGFRALLSTNHKTIYIGRFITEKEAAEAYDIYLAHHPELLHKMNQPERKEEFKSKPLHVRSTKQSKFIGVSKKGGSYFAQIRYEGTTKHILYTQSEIEAAKAYDKFVVMNNINAKLNFPADHPNFDPPFVKTVKTKMEVVDEFTCNLLTKKGEKVLIDMDDYDRIKFHSICVSKCGYSFISTGDIPKSQRLHRYIMGERNPKVIIDHIDGNPLNNTRTNLRRSDAEKNAQNRKKRKGTTSKYQGVSLHRATKWCCQVRHKKVVFKKFFESEEDAARFRDLYIMDNLPETHFKFNFEWTDEEKTSWRKKLGVPQPAEITK